MRLAATFVAAAALATSPRAMPSPQTGAAPTAESSRFTPIESLVGDAIARHELPGAVVLIGRADRVLYEKAIGSRAVLPAREPMTLDTIFDMASWTKVVATTTAVMQLVERGGIRLADPVERFIPGFGRYGKSAITIRDLMTHTSGLAPDLPLEVEFHGTDEAIRRAIELTPESAPGEEFVYSDINYFLLGHIVSVVSGEPLERYVSRHIFEPLSMRDTMFLPPETLRGRIAPTEACLPLAWPCGQPNAPWLRGVVHDPTARRMDGVAGHAGLFSSAADLSRFCRMLLHGGTLDGITILSPAAIDRMTHPATPAGMKDLRGLGWDIDTSFSANRGDLFHAGTTFGHTGFTGTSLWLDPSTGGYVIFLSNRVHPDGKGDVTALRGKVSTIAAAAISEDAWQDRSTAATHKSGNGVPDAERTLAGIDVLQSEQFARLRGKRVGLLTNQTGRTRAGDTTIDAIFHAAGVKLAALFSPEHGIRGELDTRVPSSRDEKTGLSIYSLFGARTLHPEPATLDGLDVIVADLQDAGARFYTYPAAIGFFMEEAAKRHLPVIVLDRPDPIGGISVEGPAQEFDVRRDVGYLPMPIRHGMTIGELARLFNGEGGINADLTVVPMKGWSRATWYDETGLMWINPSPNLRNLVAASLYPGIGALEQTNVSVGRGTDSPFEQVGAPWIDGPRLADALNARHLDGIRFYPVTFVPASGAKLGGLRCAGVFMIVTDRDALKPVRVGLEIASALSRMYGPEFQLEDAASLFGPKTMLAKIRAAEDPATIAASWAADEQHWRQARQKYLLY